MRDYSEQHKKAWEYDAYDFWVKTSGTPQERAQKDIADPRGMLKKYAAYFDSFEGVKIENICGSCGKKAIPLALLGAHARFYDEEIRKSIPKCSYRKYTISEIINFTLRNGFSLNQFDEHPSWEDERLPGEFTAIGIKCN